MADTAASTAAAVDGADLLLQAIGRLDQLEDDRRQASRIIGDDAWPELVSTIYALEQADPAELEYDPQQPDVYDGQLRRALRMLACVVGLGDCTLDDGAIPIALWHMIANPRLPLSVIRDACEGRGGINRGGSAYAETPASTLRQIARRLLDGEPRDTICRELHVDPWSVTKVTNMIAARQARHNRDLESARWAVRRGLTVQQAADVCGWPKGTARRLLAEARNEVRNEQDTA